MKKKKLAESGIDILCGTVSIAAFLLLWYCGTNGTELGQYQSRRNAAMETVPHRISMRHFFCYGTAAPTARSWGS